VGVLADGTSAAGVVSFIAYLAGRCIAVCKTAALPSARRKGRDRERARQTCFVNCL